MQHQLEEEEEGIEVEDGQELYPQARPSFAEFVTEQVILPFQLQQPDQPERNKSEANLIRWKPVVKRNTKIIPFTITFLIPSILF